MSKKIDLEQLQQIIKDATVQFNIIELDIGTINQFAENIFDHDQTLAQQIITGDFDTVDLQELLNNQVTYVASSENSMESIEPHWDEDEDDKNLL